jgi:hypothetical protein
MYRHVHIWNPAALHSLDEKISALCKARSIDIWSWVWTFFADHQSQSSGSDDILLTILTKTVNLIEAEIKIFVSSQLLTTLRECCPLLRSLEIFVDAKSHEAMAQVGLFKHVKYLHIFRCPYILRAPSIMTGPVSRLADVPSWNMPAVTHFSWRDRIIQPLDEATFVSRCRFPHLQHLDISIMDFETIPEGMSCICRFLDTHRNIKSLRIVAWSEQHVVVIPFVRAQNLRIYSVPRCPPPAWVSLLRPEVKSLELELSSFLLIYSADNQLGVSLWELLAQCAAEDDTQRPATLEKIHMRSLDTGRDSDLDDIMRIEGFSSTLRSHVLPLKARGICVFVDGREICV